jgi:hypothetical protein
MNEYDLPDSDGLTVCAEPISRGPIPVTTTFCGHPGVMLWDSSVSTSVGEVAEAYFKRSSPGKTTPECNLIVVMKGDQMPPLFYTKKSDQVSWVGVECAQLVPKLRRR